MHDNLIIDLFFERNERAILETQQKYGVYCHTIAMNILHDESDSEECVNDTYIAAWDSIPPTRPERLSAYLARLTRNISLNRYKSRSTARRGGGEFALSLDELDECVADTDKSAEELGKLISEFLYGEKKEARQVFVRRYFYGDSIEDISKRFTFSESKIKSMLHRTRLALREYLTQNGVYI